MALKMAKIKRQYLMSEEVGSQDLKASKTLFSGLTAFISTSIYIEHTELLSTQQQGQVVDFKYLARIWLAHGGALTQNISSGKITHFINSFLPIYFLRDIDKMRAKMRLVSPQWILDCVAHNRRMPTMPYDLQVVDADGSASDGQKKISFAPIEDHVSPAEIPLERSLQAINPPKDKNDSVVLEVPVDSQMGVPIDEDDRDQVDEYEDLPEQHQMRTSAENPNFVADYFASSRLHHLSSWKMKFQEELELHLLSLSKKKQIQEVEKSKTKTSTLHPMLDESTYQEDEIQENSRDPILAHIDMDAFFASVATRHSLALRDQPVVISHGGARALCASVNYAARKLGIKNGSRLGDIQQICKEAKKELVVLGYDFAEYELVSRQVHEIFLQYTSKIHIKSCDEAILDFSDQNQNISEISEKIKEIRRKVFETTSCTCSAGIGSSITLARFALMKAKPNGMFVAPTWRSSIENCSSLVRSNALSSLVRLLSSLRSGSISQDSYQQQALALFESGALSSEKTPSEGEIPQMKFLAEFKIEDLPGVGWRTKPKFGQMKTIGEVQEMSLATLRGLLGAKNGANVYLTARGLDPRLFTVEAAERKSISVDLSYGVRFNTEGQLSKFIKDVAEELSKRCRKIGLGGKTVSVKLWIRHPDAKPTTFLGHGYCNTFSKSTHFPTPVIDSHLLATTAERLVASFRFELSEFRGFGLSLTSLAKPPVASHSITSMFKSAVGKTALKFAPQREEEKEEPKKRLRTIDALMEKQISKATKKSKKKEESNSNSTHKLNKQVREDDKAKEKVVAFHPHRSLPSFQSTRVIAYTPVDTSVLLELRKWAADLVEPQPVHGELIFQFSQTLLELRNLEDLLRLSKALLKISSSNAKWSPFTQPVIDNIQKQVQFMYGAPLAL
jgi:DNA repair protein REV1